MALVPGVEQAPAQRHHFMWRGLTQHCSDWSLRSPDFGSVSVYASQLYKAFKQ